MITCSIDEILRFWTDAKKPDDYGVSVPLGELRALVNAYHSRLPVYGDNTTPELAGVTASRQPGAPHDPR